MIEPIIGKEFPNKVIPLIDQAKTSIDIVVFDWRWYPNDPANPVQLFNQAIVRAVRRGAKVRAIANNDEIVATLKACGVLAKRLTAKNLIHCKLMIIDDEILILGSHNYTQSAFTMNYEVSIIVEGRENLTNFINFFNNLYNTYG